MGLKTFASNLHYAPNQISEPVGADDSFPMIPLLIIFAAAALAGIVVLVVSSENAPEGYQSENGFRYGSREMIESSNTHGHAVSGSRVGSSMDRVAARSR